MKTCNPNAFDPPYHEIKSVRLPGPVLMWGWCISFQNPIPAFWTNSKKTVSVLRNLHLPSWVESLLLMVSGLWKQAHQNLCLLSELQDCYPRHIEATLCPEFRILMDQWKNLGSWFYWGLIRNPTHTLNYPNNLVPDFANDHRLEWFLPQRGIMLIALTNPIIIGSSGAICFISQFKWPISILNSIPIWFLRQMETKGLIKPEYLFEPSIWRTSGAWCSVSILY